MAHSTSTRWIVSLALLIALCGCTRIHGFDPLAHDNQWDHQIDPHDLTIMTFGDSLAYTATPPADLQDRLIFFLYNIERTSTGFYSPNGESITPITLHILQMGEQALPLTRAAFRFSLDKPEYYGKAEHLAYVLGRLRDTKAFEALALSALNHPDSSVRNTCTWALPRTGGKRAIPVLLELLYEHPTLADSRINQSAAAAALSVATGHGHDPASIYVDLREWREWGESHTGRENGLSPSVVEAVVQRRIQRLSKSVDRDRTSP